MCFIGRDAKGNIALRNSLEELFLPLFMRYASEQFASDAYLNMKRVFSEKKYYMEGEQYVWAVSGKGFNKMRRWKLG